MSLLSSSSSSSLMEDETGKSVFVTVIHVVCSTKMVGLITLVTVLVVDSYVIVDVSVVCSFKKVGVPTMSAEEEGSGGGD